MTTRENDRDRPAQPDEHPDPRPNPLRRLLQAVRMPADRTYRGGPLPRRSGGQPARSNRDGTPHDPTPELTRQDAAAELRDEQ